MNGLVQLGASRAIRSRRQRARVVLINPPALEGRTNERAFSGGIGVSRRLKPFEAEHPDLPPIDVLYLAAVAESRGAEVSVVDLVLDRLHGGGAERRCLDQLGLVGADTWIGVRLSMPSLLEDLAFADRVKVLAPTARVFAFGTVIMSTLDHWVNTTSVDYVLYGEPEAVFGELLDAEDPARVPGVIAPASYQPLQGADLYDEAKVSLRQARWVRASELGSLPRPAWHLLPMERYSAANDGLGEVAVHVQASRGCPIGCTMCPYTLLEGNSWRSNDPGRVADEIEYLNRAYGIYRVRFSDPNFGFSRKYARALADQFIARGVHLAATIESSVEVFDEETLRRLWQAGIRTITTGVETNDAACMESIGQPLRVNDKLRARVELCHRIGFQVYGTYCLGMPEETWETVEKTWRFANELDVESCFTVLTPFPGTPLYWRALREGLLPRRMQFSKWNSYSSTMRTYALTTTDLEMARWWARMETIIPYRKRRAAQRGPLALLQFYGRHALHYAWRAACRTYVAWRRRHPGPRADALEGR